MYAKAVLVILGELTPEQSRIGEILQERLAEGGLVVATIEPFSPTVGFILTLQDCQHLKENVEAVCRELGIHVHEGSVPRYLMCTGPSGVQVIGSNSHGGMPPFDPRNHI